MIFISSSENYESGQVRHVIDLYIYAVRLTSTAFPHYQNGNNEIETLCNI